MSLCYDLRNAFLSNFTQITQWKMTSAKPFFNCPCRLSISMFLQDISPIAFFITALGLNEKYFWVFFTQKMSITQWNMAACEIFSNSRWRLSICMFLQKYHLNPVFPSLSVGTGTPEKAAEKTGKKKKSRQPLKGIPSGDGMPQSYQLC